MFAPGQNQLLANLSLLLFFKDLSIVRFYDFKKNFRGMCFTVQLSKIILHCRLSQTALLLYHVVFCLSRTFFQLFSTFLKLFLFLSCSNFDILSHPTGCCQELFHFFFYSSLLDATRLCYHKSFQMSRTFFHFFPSTQKEGFEPSHGANRLYP